MFPLNLCLGYLPPPQPHPLASVQKMLDNEPGMDKVIDSPEAFEENVLLTFDNAMQYNPATHDVHVMAKALKEVRVRASRARFETHTHTHTHITQAHTDRQQVRQRGKST